MPDLEPETPPRPTISVVTPSYNQGAYLRETLDSVLSQTGRGEAFELQYVVVDGGSTDGSGAILEEYADRLDWWCSEPDGGQSPAINKGFSKCRGEIFAWLNSDDAYTPGALAAVAAEWGRDPFDVLVGRGKKVDLEGHVVHEPTSPDLSRAGILDWGANHFFQPATFFSRAAWEAVGGIDESLTYCMDVDLWARMAERFAFRRLDRHQADAKAHDAAKTTGRRTMLHCQVELALTVARHGAPEVAARDLRTLMDQYADLRDELDQTAAAPLIGPAFRALRRLGRRAARRGDG